jgi:ketosteroid isomerase-like protein
MDIKAIFESVNEAWNNAFNSKNINELSGFYAEHAILSPGNGETLTGRSHIGAHINGFLENGVNNHTLEILSVGGSDKVIYQVAKWQANGADKSTFGGITTNVLEQGADGKWLSNAHVWNLKA